MVRHFFKVVIRKFFWIGFRRCLSDKQYVKLRYWLELNQPLNLKNPQRFTEKIQHLKLYDHRNLRKIFADRTKVRDYVAKIIGDHYLIPIIGIYEDLSCPVWKSLPKQFVLKANHGSGMICIVSDKATENYRQVYRQTEQWKEKNFYDEDREWAYKNLPRTLVAEELLLTSRQTIPEDYKFFCFNGRVKLIQVDFDRFKNQKRNLYDRDFNQVDASLLYPNYKGEVQRPRQLAKAIEIAERLADDINFVRVDLYLLQNHIYFGEMTNYPGKGLYAFKPESMEYRMGSYLRL